MSRAARLRLQAALEEQPKASQPSSQSVAPDELICASAAGADGSSSTAVGAVDDGEGLLGPVCVTGPNVNGTQAQQPEAGFVTTTKKTTRNRAARLAAAVVADEMYVPLEGNAAREDDFFSSAFGALRRARKSRLAALANAELNDDAKPAGFAVWTSRPAAAAPESLQAAVEADAIDEVVTIAAEADRQSEQSAIAITIPAVHHGMVAKPDDQQRAGSIAAALRIQAAFRVWAARREAKTRREAQQESITTAVADPIPGSLHPEQKVVASQFAITPHESRTAVSKKTRLQKLAAAAALVNPDDGVAPLATKTSATDLHVPPDSRLFVSMQLSGVNLGALVSDKQRRAQFERTMKSAIAATIGHCVHTSDVEVYFSEESPLLQFVVTPPAGVSSTAIKASLLPADQLKKLVPEAVFNLHAAGSIVTGVVIVRDVRVSTESASSAAAIRRRSSTLQLQQILVADVSASLSHPVPNAIVLALTVQGLDYKKLIGRGRLLSNFETAMREELAAMSGDGVYPKHVTLYYEAGLTLQATIRPPSGVEVMTVHGLLASCSQTLGDRLVEQVSSLQGISDVVSGPIAFKCIVIKAEYQPPPGEEKSAREIAVLPGSSGPLRLSQATNISDKATSARTHRPSVSRGTAGWAIEAAPEQAHLANLQFPTMPQKLSEYREDMKRIELQKEVESLKSLRRGLEFIHREEDASLVDVEAANFLVELGGDAANILGARLGAEALRPETLQRPSALLADVDVSHFMTEVSPAPTGALDSLLRSPRPTMTYAGDVHPTPESRAAAAAAAEEAARVDAQLLFDCTLEAQGISRVPRSAAVRMEDYPHSTASSCGKSSSDDLWPRLVLDDGSPTTSTYPHRLAAYEAAFATAADAQANHVGAKASWHAEVERLRRGLREFAARESLTPR